jgi:hypothetical protein
MSLPKKRRLTGGFYVMFFALALTGMSCGGGGSSSTGPSGGGSAPTDPGTPLGSYSVTITAVSSTNITHTTTLQLTVN